MSVVSLLPVKAASQGVAVSSRIRPSGSDFSSMTRYRGGTYSHTVDRVVFADGSTARTDLIRLNPNIEAYSLNFNGVAPTRPSRYRAATWSAVSHLRSRSYEAEVDWIIRNSFPALGTVELSRRLRAAGYPLGQANLAEHEAIAATQAAIWFFTNGLALDDRPRNMPVAVRPTAGGIVFEFDGQPQLGGYTVTVESNAAVSLLLQKSADGLRWDDVASSGLNVAAGRNRHQRTLGLGSTVSSTRPGRTGHGYRFYRLVVVADSVTDHRMRIADVEFSLNGSATYANPDRVVHLYSHLIAGARAARNATVTPALWASDAVVDAGMVGPFRLQATDRAVLTVTHGSIVDSAGTELSGPVDPGGQFYLRPQPGTETATVTAHVPAGPDGFGGRVITGVARDATNSGLTPVVLAVPTQLEAEFDISWTAAASQTRRPA